MTETTETLDLDAMRERTRRAKEVIWVYGDWDEHEQLANDNLALIAYVERLRDVIAGMVEGTE